LITWNALGLQIGEVHGEKLDMKERHRLANTGKPKRQAGAANKRFEQRGGARPDAEGRAWDNVNKLHGGGKKIGSGRKVPNGPVGGLGRKTNLARSS
jgi:ribosomal protein L2